MATPLITSASDPLIKMVRDYNVLLSDTNQPTSKAILDYLNNHAFPRIRGRLLTATDSTKKHIFYDDISNLADSTAQKRADELVIKVMTDSIVKDFIYRIAAAMAASWAINNIVGIIPEQQKLAKDLEKEALDDLALLVTSPELSAAAIEAQRKLESAPEDQIPKIFMALDINPATYNANTSAAKTYTGAQEAGEIRLWMGIYKISAPVNQGDTVAVIMNRLTSALRTAKITDPGFATGYNLVIGPNEGPTVTGMNYITFSTPAGQSVTASPVVTTNVGWLSFHAQQMDPQIDAMFCTLELVNAEGKPGIKGIIYGVMEGAIDYSKLSPRGPYSVFIDLVSGKSGVKNSQLLDVDQRDTFYFTVETEDSKTSAAGSVKYQITNLVSLGAAAPSLQPRSVTIPSGSTALDVATLIAKDMALVGYQQKLLPALRSPTALSPMGSMSSAPGLRLIPYRPSGFEDRVVVDILEVPPDVKFGVVPPSLATASTFDNLPKSLVLNIRFVQGQASKLSPLSTLSGKTYLIEPTGSTNLRSALRDINYFNRGQY